MTDPTLDWLRSEMQDARERAKARKATPMPPVQEGHKILLRRDLPAALSVLDRIGEALAQFTESHLDRHLYVPLDKHGESEAADLLAELRDVALRREADDGAS